MIIIETEKKEKWNRQCQNGEDVSKCNRGKIRNKINVNLCIEISGSRRSLTHSIAFEKHFRFYCHRFSIWMMFACVLHKTRASSFFPLSPKRYVFDKDNARRDEAKRIFHSKTKNISKWMRNALWPKKMACHFIRIPLTWLLTEMDCLSGIITFLGKWISLSLLENFSCSFALSSSLTILVLKRFGLLIYSTTGNVLSYPFAMVHSIFASSLCMTVHSFKKQFLLPIARDCFSFNCFTAPLSCPFAVLLFFYFFSFSAIFFHFTYLNFGFVLFICNADSVGRI